jgi:hypothetical protein
MTGANVKTLEMVTAEGNREVFAEYGSQRVTK